jgi:hypothetical protein
MKIEHIPAVPSPSLILGEFIRVTRIAGSPQSVALPRIADSTAVRATIARGAAAQLCLNSVPRRSRNREHSAARVSAARSVQRAAQVSGTIRSKRLVNPARQKRPLRARRPRPMRVASPVTLAFGVWRALRAAVTR